MKKLNQKKKNRNIQPDIVIFLGFILTLVFTLFYVGGGITGAAIGIIGNETNFTTQTFLTI
jgi:hypothetical protein